MMSVPSVKPAIPSGMQSAKVGSSPPSTTGSVLPQPTLGTTKSSNIASSPIKIPVTSNTNHSSILPLSLVQEHKNVTGNLLNQQQPPSLLQYPLVRTTEKSKDVVPGNKPTSNGVEESPTKPQADTVTPNLANFGDQKREEVPVMNHASEVPVTLAPPISSATTVSQESETVHSTTVTISGATVTTTTTTTTQGSETTAVSVTHKKDESVTSKKEESVPSKKEESDASSVNVAAAAVDNSSPVNPKSDIPGSEVKAQILNTITAGSENTEPVKKPVENVKTKRDTSLKQEFKVATPPRNTKRKREAKPPQEVKTVTATTSQTDERKPKRARVPTQPYQSPLPELLFNAKMKPSVKAPEEKLIVFYKNEFLAVRNAEGSFFVCQTTQNIYKNSAKIRIRWLSQEKKDNVYVPDFYDTTDFDCILTNLDLKRMSKNKFALPASELERTQNILKRALDVEKGVLEKPSVTEEHPDGLDLSLYHDETQLKTPQAKRSNKRKKSKVKSMEHVDDKTDEVEVDVPAKVEAKLSAEDSESLKKKIKLSPKKADKPKTNTKENSNKEKSKSPIHEKKVDMQPPTAKEKTRDKRKSESANKTADTTKSALATKAALTKQAAVKQTVARQVLPQSAKEKKKDKEATVVVKTPVKKSEGAEESTTPKKTRSGRNVVAPVLPSSSPSPPSTPPSSTTAATVSAPSPPKITPVTRTKENEPQRVTITIKGRKKTSKRT